MAKRSAKIPGDWPLVYVEWEDSYGCSASWGSAENVKPAPVVCVSVGWLASDGKRLKTIIPHVGRNEHGRQGCGDMTIPTRAILKMKRLTV